MRTTPFLHAIGIPTTNYISSSVRDPILTDHFWLNPLSQHFATIRVSDLILVNEDGEVVIGDQPINAAAFAIHSESRSLFDIASNQYEH